MFKINKALDIYIFFLHICTGFLTICYNATLLYDKVVHLLLFRLLKNQMVDTLYSSNKKKVLMNRLSRHCLKLQII